MRYAQDLQTKSLKDLQSRIVDQIDDLLLQVESKESTSLDAHFSRISTKSTRFDDYSDRSYSARQYNKRNDYREHNKRNDYLSNLSTKKTQHVKKLFPSVKKCEACHSGGETFIGHEVRNCPKILPSDRESLMKTFSLEVNDDEDDVTNVYESANIVVRGSGYREAVDVERVNIVESPKFNVKINKTIVTMVLDTGATGSMISLEMCELANLHVYPSSHSAIQADGDSQLQVVGEVHSSILLDNYLTLPISAVVVTRLKEGLIVGTLSDKI